MSYNHLSWNERYHIEELKREGFSQIEIAEKLGRSRCDVIAVSEITAPSKATKKLAGVFQHGAC